MRRVCCLCALLAQDMTLTLSARRWSCVNNFLGETAARSPLLAFTLVCNFLLEFASPKKSSQKWRKVPRNTQGAAEAAAAQLSEGRGVERLAEHIANDDCN